MLLFLSVLAFKRYQTRKLNVGSCDRILLQTFFFSVFRVKFKSNVPSCSDLKKRLILFRFLVR